MEIFERITYARDQALEAERTERRRLADADTAVAGAIGLYGYYGRLGLETRDISDPVRHAASGAPPVAIIHGTHRTSAVPPK